VRNKTTLPHPRKIAESIICTLESQVKHYKARADQLEADLENLKMEVEHNLKPEIRSLNLLCEGYLGTLKEKDAIIACCKTQIEAMRCCGNCKQYNNYMKYHRADCLKNTKEWLDCVNHECSHWQPKEAGK